MEVESSGDEGHPQAGFEVDKELLKELHSFQGRFGNVSPRGSVECRPLKGSVLLSDALNLDLVAISPDMSCHSPKGADPPAMAQSKHQGVQARFLSDGTLCSSKSSASNSFTLLSND